MARYFLIFGHLQMNIDNFYLVCLVYTEKQAIRIKCLQGLACSPPISVRPPCITEGIIFCLPNIQQLTTVHVNKQNLDPIDNEIPNWAC